MSRTVMVAAAVLAFAPAAAGQGLSERDALNELSSEYGQCAAYYAIGTECSSVNQTETQRMLDNAWRDLAIKGMYKFGSMAGLSEQALAQRFDLSVKTLFGGGMGSQCSNFGVLMSAFSEQCPTLMDDPQKRFEELVN